MPPHGFGPTHCEIFCLFKDDIALNVSTWRQEVQMPGVQSLWNWISSSVCKNAPFFLKICTLFRSLEMKYSTKIQLRIFSFRLTFLKKFIELDKCGLLQISSSMMSSFTKTFHCNIFVWNASHLSWTLLFCCCCCCGLVVL